MKQRILLYLLEAPNPRDAAEAPYGLTRDGVSRATGIAVRHLAQYAGPLQRGGLVRVRLAHVKGLHQRRRVYELTEAGGLAARRLREALSAEVVRVDGTAGMRETNLGEALREAVGKTSFLRAAQQVAEAGVLDLRDLAPIPPRALVEMMSTAPRLARFVGRGAELDALTSEGSGPRVFVVRGVAGIGKTSLGVRACDVLRGQTSLFWHQVRSWDTPLSMLQELGGFFRSLAKPGLSSVVARADTAAAMEVLRESLAGTNAFLVFDDAHEAKREVCRLLRFLKDAVADAPEVRVLFLTRRALAIYDRRDVVVRKVVREIELRGLRPDEVAALFPDPPAEHVWGKAVLRLHGHPLFLEMLQNTGPLKPGFWIPDEVHRFIREEVYVNLSASGRRMMKVASLYTVPVPPEALFADASLTADVVAYLADRGLLRMTEEGTVEVHETIRDFFSTVLSRAEQARLRPFALKELRGLVLAARRARRAAACVGFLQNALRLARSQRQRCGLLEELGDADQQLGDLPAALIAYKEGMNSSPAREALARLHRKAASVLRDRAEYVAAREEAAAGVEALPSDAIEERAWLELVLGRISASVGSLGSLDDGWRHLSEALRLFETSDLVYGEANAVLELAKLAVDTPGRRSVATGYFQAALELGTSFDDPSFLAAVHVGLAEFVVNRFGRVDEARQHLLAVEANPEALADPRVRMRVELVDGWIELRCFQNFALARRHCMEALRIARTIHHAPTVALARWVMAGIIGDEGSTEDGLRAAEDLAADFAAQGLPSRELGALIGVGELLLLQGDVRGFRQLVRRFNEPKFAKEFRGDPGIGELRCLDRLLDGDSRGCRDEIEGVMRLVEKDPWGDEEGFDLEMGDAHFYYGVALETMGDLSGAEEHFDAALDLYGRLGVPRRVSRTPEWRRRFVEVLRDASRPLEVATLARSRETSTPRTRDPV